MMSATNAMSVPKTKKIQKITPDYECGYCLKRYVKEAAFLKHTCKQKQRHANIKSLETQIAYTYYAKWMELYKRSIPSIETFVTSMFYTSFINFYNHIKKVQISDPYRYIRLMSQRDISPTLWCENACYVIYLDWFDKRSTPEEQADITVDTIFKLMDQYEVPTASAALMKLDSKELIELIRLKKLSPWVMLSSKIFNNIIKTMDDGDAKELIKTIGYGYWTKKQEKNPEIVEQMQTIVNELGL